MDPQGFEPWASSLQRRHSPTELWAHSSQREELGVSLGSSEVPGRPVMGAYRTGRVYGGPGRRPGPGQWR